MRKYNIVLIIMLLFSLSTGLYALNGIQSLGIDDNAYVINNGRADKKVALFLAKASDIAYHDLLSTTDKEFFSDNGFSNVTLDTSLDGVEFLTATKNITVADKEKKLILVSFRGTQEAEDIWTDHEKSAEKFVDNDVLVHSGFETYMKRFEEKDSSIIIDGSTSLREYILLKSDDIVFIFTGHSLGGAVAKLYAASLTKMGIPSQNLFVYTYGAPPVGYSTGKVTFAQKYRMKRRGDGVTDSQDAWPNDSRYTQDKNSNSIPDILDVAFDLNDTTPTGTTMIYGTDVNVRDIISNGGYIAPNTSTKTISLYAGWNLVSANITNVANISTKAKILWKYENGIWSAYSSNTDVKTAIQNSGLATFTSLTNGQGFWILANESFDLEVSENSSVNGGNYSSGWHMLGVGTDTPLSSYGCTSGSVVSAWKYIDNSWQLHTSVPNNLNFTSFDMIDANEGFWLDCQDDLQMDGLIAYYKFDNNSKDYGVNKNDLIFQSTLFAGHNNQENYTQGKINEALDLNDSKYYSDNLGQYTFQSGATISLWIKTTELDTRAMALAIVSKNTSSSNTSALGIDVYYPSHSGWKFALSIASSSGAHYEVYPSNEPKITLNKWYHIVYTISANGSVRDWYNGQEGIGAEIPSPEFLTWDLNDYKLQVGSRNEGVNFNGAIDELKIYNRVLTEDEIHALYNAGL